ncbi:hypothetical protein LIER_02556 [Lithospermum erythrorhizon]|uniref:Uncharacterized protein n=1 Tax=Lithospermum erythrorhizon TaxID=34254 RepID=A0AAV3NRB2_LITER
MKMMLSNMFNDPPVPLATGSLEETRPITAWVKKNEDDVVKYEKDNKTVRYHILNHMVDNLFDLFMIHKSTKVIWEALEKKYRLMMLVRRNMLWENGYLGGSIEEIWADDANKKKYVVGKWLEFKMVDGKPIMYQVHEFENLCTDVTNEGIKLDEVFPANILLEKFPPFWSEYRNRLKHKKRDMPLQELISHMRSEEANRLKDKTDRVTLHNSTNVNMVETTAPSNVNRKQGHKAYQCNSRPQKQASQKTPQAHLAKSDDVIVAIVVVANFVANTND